MNSGTDKGIDKGITAAQELFKSHFGSEATHQVQAPGRVNLIGDHTDYIDGFVFPAALSLKTCFSFKKNNTNQVNAISSGIGSITNFELKGAKVDDWGKYLAGVAWALTEAGHKLSGLDIAIHSNVPTGSGLSSSAAIEVAAARAWREIDNLDISDVELALLCKKAENDYVGIPCGILDQFACSVPDIGQAVVLDCKSLEYDVVSIPEEWLFVVINSNAPHSHDDSGYETRVQECQAIATELDLDGLKGLRNLEADDFQKLSDETLQKRARHLYSENARVDLAKVAMQTANQKRFGELMTESHISLRDDYQTSADAPDKLMEACISFSGCFGSRITGGGFGGCVVSLVNKQDKDAFIKHVLELYPQGTFEADVSA